MKIVALVNNYFLAVTFRSFDPEHLDFSSTEHFSLQDAIKNATSIPLLSYEDLKDIELMIKSNEQANDLSDLNFYLSCIFEPND